jgi:hypothetical protein
MRKARRSIALRNRSSVESRLVATFARSAVEAGVGKSRGKMEAIVVMSGAPVSSDLNAARPDPLTVDTQKACRRPRFNGRGMALCTMASRQRKTLVDCTGTSDNGGNGFVTI